MTANSDHHWIKDWKYSGYLLISSSCKTFQHDQYMKTHQDEFVKLKADAFS